MVLTKVMALPLEDADRVERSPGWNGDAGL